mmetsp:Transcript_5757/g.16991  ORF Transcript_5757/g.16991 Transcript_5757/m.16991 type:complete len:153 (+) Transcript_5757:261-719(+)|eukprot:CAMPEP_0119260378 /NCGR_PEP_ID=MMETSP1329-20130426/790_1 /TAXON_ID=114041 /ORGANISM="Genus nov. species nov., Strain RCC1024" /LENGTH=152 /DNA_ID=CAMNT_0007259801 /DNA_START=246 /DNA_END=704 /DNA_ORIENTATION=+
MPKAPTAGDDSESSSDESSLAPSDSEEEDENAPAPSPQQPKAAKPPSSAKKPPAPAPSSAEKPPAGLRNPFKPVTAAPDEAALAAAKKYEDQLLYKRVCPDKLTRELLRYGWKKVAYNHQSHWRHPNGDIYRTTNSILKALPYLLTECAKDK